MAHSDDLTDEDILEVIAGFDLGGALVEVEAYGSGHINQTFRSVFLEEGRRVRYIHQRINHHVFHRPDELMENVQRVLAHQAQKVFAAGRDQPGRRSLTLVRGHDGLPYLRDRRGAWWRTYLCIEGARSLDVLETPDQARAIARAVGLFQLDLADFPLPRLHETIPRFHDAEARYDAFRATCRADVLGRVSSVRAEVDWFLAQESVTTAVVRDLRDGSLPERITHNDTKANNILVDDATGEGICVIDLDTVMPGSLIYDFGDLVRTGTGTAAEDEADASKMAFDLARFRALVEGFYEVALPILTESEKRLMPLAGRILGTIIGLRFLTDYLDGDRYYKTSRPGHNLDRARTQMALVKAMDREQSALEATCRAVEAQFSERRSV